MTRALITGITGQDGPYLAELLLTKGYEVFGMHRRSSTDNHLQKVKHLLDNKNFHLVCGDLTDGHSIEQVLDRAQPDEVYNLASQSHVGVSFEQPYYTREVNFFGLQRLSNILFEQNKNAKLYQASTSELFGEVLESPQSETTPFNPVSPYSKAKLEAHEHIGQLRKEGYFACAGILFNHESPNRGVNFVTRKITNAAAKISLGLQDELYLGNLNAKRDWGHAQDYVIAMWLMIQQEKPNDYVIGTGKSYSVRDFVNFAFKEAGISLDWQGEGLDEVGINKKDGKLIVRVNPEYFRPAEVNLLNADYTRAKQELGWEPTTSFEELARGMVKADIKRAEDEFFLSKRIN